MTNEQLDTILEKIHSAYTHRLMHRGQPLSPAELEALEDAEEKLNDLRTQLALAPPQAQCPKCRKALGLPSEETIAAMTETQVLALLFGKSKPNRRRK